MTVKSKSLEDQLMVNQDKVDKLIMRQLATNDDSKIIIDDLLSKDIPTQLRAFVLLKARNELMRIIQVSETLQDLEDTYMERISSDKEGMDVKSLAEAIDNISDVLQRSMDLVYSVINDKELKLVIEQTTNVYNDNRTTTNNYTSVVNSPESREKLRQVATRLLNQISENPAVLVNTEPITDQDKVIDADIIDKD